MSRLTTLTSRQEKLKLNPPFIVTMNNTTSNIDISSNLTTNLSISSNLIINTVQNGKSIIYLGTQYSTTSALKTAIIAEGMNDWSRAKLHFCLNNMGDRGTGVLPDGNNTNYNASVADARMTILYTGFVGIGNTNPVSLLSLNATPRSADTFNWGNCPMTITHPTITGATASTLNDPKPILHLCRDGTVNTNYAERATFNLCRYEHPSVAPTTGSRTRLDIGLTHTTFDDEICVMSLRSDGNVGIGKTNPNCRLYISANLAASATVYAMRLSSGAATDNGGFGTLLGLGSEPNGWSKCAIGHTRTANYDQGDIIFLSRATADNADCTMSDEKMRIKSNGNVGIGTTNPSTRLHIQHASTSPDGWSGGLYVYNPNDAANHCSVIGVRIGGKSADKALLSFDSASEYGWSIFLKGGDTTQTLRFNNSWNGTGTDRLQISNAGVVSAANYNIGATSINNYLFNNQGANHSTYKDFDLIDKFGYTYIQDKTNGPGTGAEQYYSWYIGLGNDYPFNNVNNERYGMQFAIARTETNPKLCVRRKEANVWRGWEGLTAEKAVSLTTGDKTISGTLTVSTNIDCGGGIAITGSTAFWQPNGSAIDVAVDDGNLTNTYINFKGAGAGTDWCYLRQIGQPELYKLALDFHDDNNDARFCIRSVRSAVAGGVDVINEVFTVDMGNVKATGTVRATGFTAVNGEYELMIAPPTATAAATIQTIQQNTGFNQNLTLQAVTNSGNVGIGITNPACKLEIKGAVGINNGSSYAIANNKMQAGSLTIGDQTLNYGGGSDWTANTAGLMFECLDNTEIAVHDSGSRIASLMYFEGGDTNRITIGRNWPPWTAIYSVVLNGNVTCAGSFTNGATSYIYAGGLRLGGFDTGNTIWQDTGDLGISANTGNNIKFAIGNGSEKMRIKSDGNVGIGTNNPTNIFQVGDGARLRISNGVSDYSVIGTKDVDDNTNTRIVISGNTRGSYEGQIQYLATAGSHIFYTNATNERMRIKSNGYVGIGTTDPKSLLTINTPPTVTDPISFDYSSCPLTITNTNTTGSTINDPKPVLFLCRNGVAGQSYGSKASFNLCRFENAGNTHSRTRLDIGLTNENFNDVNIMSLRSDGNVGIGATNPGTYRLNVNGSTYINGTLITNKIGIGNNTPVGTLHIGTSVYQSDTSLYISANNVGNRTCRMGYNSDWSFCIGDIGQSDSGTWKPQILINYAAPANSISIDSIGRVYGNFIGYSDERLKSNIQTIDNALLKVQELRGVTFTFISDNTRDIGLIAQEVEYIIPEAVKENELNNTKGINYSCLVGLLVQAVKELNNKVIKLENILINNNLN